MHSEIFNNVLISILLIVSPVEPTAAPPEPKWSDHESGVNHLTDEKFGGFVENREHVLVMFYAPCKYCVTL